ncbi:hypothetical protein AB0J74_14655 [Asanoa sp. NPDC049573]|uniref:hypothetical protein n=1 Tax=Asanoa sp. NPDC049573 TaxID=3155396 RepID=UPI00343E1924
MLRIAKISAVTLAVLSLVVGCSSGGRPPQGEAAASGDIGITESVAPSLIPHQIGQSFPYRETFSDDTSPVDWQVEVTKVQCGIRVLKNAADNPAYTSGNWSSDNVPPERIDAKAPSGQAFCRMDATLKNVGNTPASGTEDFGNIDTDKGQFASSYDEDAYIASNLLEDEDAPGSPFNPGSTARVIKIWTAPADAKPLAVLFPADTAFDKSSHRIMVS